MVQSTGAGEIERTLRESFRFAGFRTGQRELIEAVLAGRDALGVLPTGGGKSLTYQLPASLLPGLTLVVSPLIALMKDQVDAFNRRGGKLAVAVHSNLSPAEAREAIALASGGKASLLYVAPERFEHSGFRERILALKPNLFVVDEAHCVNQWGYDFRPSYLTLAGMAAASWPAPVLALTATATPATRSEVSSRLGLVKPLVFVAPFDRSNLRLEVHPCGPREKPRRLRRLLVESAGTGSHIVYVGRRKDAEEIASELNAEGLGAVRYHAGMHPDARKSAQEDWLSGRKPIAVATVAFGMGIDKADVRSVIHYQHPASLEAYYQEAGRAGRDGAPARCITLYSGKDVALSHFFIRNRYPLPEQVHQLFALLSPEGATQDGIRGVMSELSDEQFNMAVWVLLEQRRIFRDEEGLLRRKKPGGAEGPVSMNALYARKRADYRRLEEVIAYCEDPVCHRLHLLRYFGEQLPAGFRCGNCSACREGTAAVGLAAARDEAARIYRLNREKLEAGAPVTPKSLARFLAGSGARNLPGNWRRLPGFGALKNTAAPELIEISALAIERESAAPGAGGQLRLVRHSASQDVPAGSSPVCASAVEYDMGEKPDPAVFWKANQRSLTVDKLKERKVPRTVGISILKLMEESSVALPPSGIANTLLGRRASDAVRKHTALPDLKQFGSERGRSYDDTLFDILSMWAKGYLRPSPGFTRRLELSETGRAALTKGSPPRKA